MKVEGIIRKHLIDNGFDGLYNPDCYPDNGCGCEIGDLFLCAENPFDCQPGYAIELEDNGVKYTGISIDKPQELSK